ncbi:MAG: GGDEF domain-containing protein [Nocardioidaceae bacterium]|nr:GGDEF domain-containing protein [Nocardioidaceae bacterium]
MDGAESFPRGQHDPATGLATEATLTEQLADALLARQHSGHQVALLHVDCTALGAVDGWAGCRDRDRVRAGLVGRLRRSVRASDPVGRLADDEFAVVCTDLHHAREAELVAARLQTALAVPLEVGDESMRVPVSVGVDVAGPWSRPEAMVDDARAISRHRRRTG